MDSKLFKKHFNDIFVRGGFAKKGSFFYLMSDDVICVVGLQMSNYSTGFYINLGYVIRQLNPTLETPRDVDGDLRTRFTTMVNGKAVDIFDPEKIENIEELNSSITENIDSLIKGFLSINGLKALIAKDPTLLYQVKITAKRLLGYGDS